MKHRLLGPLPDPTLERLVPYKDSPIVLDDDVEPLTPSKKAVSPPRPRPPTCKDGHAECDIDHKDGRYPRD